MCIHETQQGKNMKKVLMAYTGFVQMMTYKIERPFKDILMTEAK